MRKGILRKEGCVPKLFLILFFIENRDKIGKGRRKVGVGLLSSAILSSDPKEAFFNCFEVFLVYYLFAE